jgi:hypothetical protein
MKETKLHHGLASVACGLALVGAASTAPAQTFTNVIVAQFDTASDPFSNLYVWWGGPIFTCE